MAFVVEDGTIVSGANAYATLEFVDAYFTDRGRTEWSGTDAEKQTYIVRATDHIERRFGHRFKGRKVQASQPLFWPRSGVSLRDGSGLPDNEIPDLLKRACAEYARLAKDRKELDPVPMEIGADVTGKVLRRSTSQSVGSLSTSTDEQYSDPAQKIYHSQLQGGKDPTSLTVQESSLMEYPQADLFLEELIQDIDTREDAMMAPPCVDGDDEGGQLYEGWRRRWDYRGQEFGGGRYGVYFWGYF